MQRKINALKFELESGDGKIIELIAWIQDDGNGKHLVPAHPDHCLLDVRAGDVVTYMRKKLMTVRRLKPWRTSECKDDTQYGEITCGRDWEAGE